MNVCYNYIGTFNSWVSLQSIKLGGDIMGKKDFLISTLLTIILLLIVLLFVVLI